MCQLHFNVQTTRLEHLLRLVWHWRNPYSLRHLGSSTMRITSDVLVIGAGIAGCGIAAAIARQGRRVVVVERSLREPDRIVGELLQPGGVAALSQLGLAPCLESIEATPVEGYHLYWKDQQATFWFCPVSSNSKHEPPTKPAGRSFHHGRFVANLRTAVASDPNITLLESTALELLRHEATGAVVGAICSRNGAPPEEVCQDEVVGLPDLSNARYRILVSRPPHCPCGRGCLELQVPVHPSSTKGAVPVLGTGDG
jgi:squalene monooxygenase